MFSPDIIASLDQYERDQRAYWEGVLASKRPRTIICECGGRTVMTVIGPNGPPPQEWTCWLCARFAHTGARWNPA